MMEVPKSVNVMKGTCAFSGVWVFPDSIAPGHRMAVPKEAPTGTCGRYGPDTPANREPIAIPLSFLFYICVLLPQVSIVFPVRKEGWSAIY